MSFPLDKQSYELLHLIGEGTGSKVYIARCVLNGRLCCIKLVNIDDVSFDINHWRKGTSFWSQCTNENIIDYYGSFTIDSTLWFLTEYMDGGSLQQIMQYAYPRGFKDEILIASILENVLNFLDYFHENNQIHRDIRPGNILLSSDGDVKVGDAGFAASLIELGQRKRAKFTVVGSPIYSAPELLKETGYTEKADIWSIGITAIELITGTPPGYGMTNMQIVQSIIEGPAPTVKASVGASSKFIEFISMCLDKNPEKRASAKDLLKSQFIKRSKGKKYIASTLMCNMPPLYQRYGMQHPQAATTPPPPPALTPEETPMSIRNPGFIFPGEEKVTAPKVEEPPPKPREEKVTVKQKGRFTVTIHTPPPDETIMPARPFSPPQQAPAPISEAKPQSPPIVQRSSSQQPIQPSSESEELVVKVGELNVRVGALEKSNVEIQSEIDEVRILLSKMK